MCCIAQFLTIRLLESRTGGSTTVLLWFASTRIAHQHVSIIVHENIAQFVFGTLVDVLGVVSDDALGNGRSNGVNLTGNTTALDADPNVEIGEFVLANDQDWFKNLQAKSFWFNIFNRLTIHLDESAALLGKGDGRRGLFPDGNGEWMELQGLAIISACVYLLSEHLNRLCGRHGVIDS